MQGVYKDRFIKLTKYDLKLIEHFQSLAALKHINVVGRVITVNNTTRSF